MPEPADAPQACGGAPPAEDDDRQRAAGIAYADLVRLGVQLYEAGDLEPASAAFQAMTVAQPERAVSWNYLALAWVDLGRLEDAAAALCRSLDLDPVQLETWQSLASVLLRLGRWEGAESACARALELDGKSVVAWHARALALTELNDLPGAAEAFARTIEFGGETADRSANLGAALMRCGRYQEAEGWLAAALAREPSLPAIVEAKQVCDLILRALVGDIAPMGASPAGAVDPTPSEVDRICRTALLLLDAAGDRPAAIRVAEGWAVQRPDSREALHLREATRSRHVERQPAELVAERFDELAEDFDEHLGRLGYDGPGQLRSLISPWVSPDRSMDILDLGCGTGLCAGVLRPYARRLVGIDLSPNMLRRAGELNLYDQLEVSDLVEILAQHQGRWDLIVAFDTFPYLGALNEVFAAAAAALRPWGLFAFSTEAAEVESYLLRGNGRYAHGPQYIAQLAAERFEIIAARMATLRREAGRAVEGGYFLLRSSRATDAPNSRPDSATPRTD
jgi:predicted TPR repeat methyltransferase/Tfp pilus assembly protein PilF